MTAKEMFEELGYEYGNNNHLISLGLDQKQIIVYENTNKNFVIVFRLEEEIIQKGIMRNNGDIKGFGTFGFDELKAINKQVEELGWLNES